MSSNQWSQVFDTLKSLTFKFRWDSECPGGMILDLSSRSPARGGRQTSTRQKQAVTRSPPPQPVYEELMSNRVSVRLHVWVCFYQPRKCPRQIWPWFSAGGWAEPQPREGSAYPAESRFTQVRQMPRARSACCSLFPSGGSAFTDQLCPEPESVLKREERRVLTHEGSVSSEVISSSADAARSAGGTDSWVGGGGGGHQTHEDGPLV